MGYIFLDAECEINKILQTGGERNNLSSSKNSNWMVAPLRRMRITPVRPPPRSETQVQRDMMFLPHPPLFGELPSMSEGQRRLIHLNLLRRFIGRHFSLNVQ